MIVLGVDEVGRGCIAGPLVVGVVVLRHPLPGLKDSKLLSQLKRQTLAKLIYEQADQTALGWVSAFELDKIGLTNSLSLAALRALQNLTCDYDMVILDGKFNYLPKNVNVQTMIGADNIIPSVSAASIIAKVARDSYMIKQDSIFPNYGFKNNVGYGTKFHIEALLNNGICQLHRQTFEPVKSYLSRNNLIKTSRHAVSIAPAK